MKRGLPTGTVTFLYTDVEGSTKLLQELGAEAYAGALAEHRRILRKAFSAHDGVEVDTQGDAFFVAFPTPPGALAAAREAKEALAEGPIRVRMGIHTGTPHVADEGYVGEDVHLGARIAAAGHGGQVLLSKATRDLVDGDVSDLGEHRLKDFAEAVWLFQLGPERFPPLKTLSNTNLPRPPSSFVGRQRQVDEVASALQGGARLLTLTGPGGSGKTRLAIETAAELVPQFPSGVFWVGLAPLRDPRLVTATIAQTLGAKDGLAEHIGERELLLLIDNFEQVIVAAPELASLVETCPNLQLLITSRELLRVRGEVEYPVTPLAELEAVELFSARSRLEPDSTVAELCHRLDNLPLAVELAAARTSVLSPRQILGRLSERLDLLEGGRDAEARQATLRATIEWSHDLLSEEEQRLFARLSVFAASCTLEAAEPVCGADLDTLQSLAEKNLIRHLDERFWMLETIREYATERLEESSEAGELRRCHAEYFLALAKQAEPHLRSGSPKDWTDRLECDHENFRAALDWLAATGEARLAQDLAAALWRFWNNRGHTTEGRHRLESALQADNTPTRARARALGAAGALAANGGDHATARLRLEEALALYRRLGDAWGVAHTTFNLGGVAGAGGDLATARQIYEKSIGAFRELGDNYYALTATRFLAWVYYDLGERVRARALDEDLVRQARALGDEPLLAGALSALAHDTIRHGQVQESLPNLKEGTRIYHRLGYPSFVAWNLCGFARVLALEARPEKSIRLLAASESLYEESGQDVGASLKDTNEETLAIVRKQLDDAAVARAWERGHKLSVDEAVALAFESTS